MQRVHYTGAINGGMSGGPALDRRGRVYGVNVSVVSGRQLVGFIVPARHIPPLLARAREPMELSLSAQQLRQRVTAQVLAYEAEVLEARPDSAGTQTVQGYALPTQISPHIECSTIDESSPHVLVSVETVSCWIPALIRVQQGVHVAGLSMRHRILQSEGLQSPAVRTAGKRSRRGPAPHGLGNPRRAIRLPRRAGFAGRLRCANLDLRAPVPALRRSL